VQWGKSAGYKLATILFATLIPGCSPDSLYELFTDDPKVQLPQDESPHTSGGEWWYYTGELNSTTGKTFGVEAVIFHGSGLRFAFPFIDLWVSHYAITNVESQTFIYSQSYWYEWFPDRSQEETGFDLYTSLVQMSGLNGLDHLTAKTSDNNYVLTLDLADQRGVIFHGDNGYVPYGDLSSFYYSRPIMQAAGSLVVDGETLDVTGDIWFDRQWGRDVIDPSLQWDWFSLRLDDGASIMLFIFRETIPALYEGTYIPAIGDTVALTADDFTITATNWWTSSLTNCTYPVAWEIVIPSQSLTLTVQAVLDTQEFDASETTGNIYWEGLCTITGTRSNQPITGSAYIELTNY
jgi:predicted secreted hydrolase